MIPLLRDIEIRGNYFRDDVAQHIYQTLQVGDTLDTELEPTNEHDQYAVKVIRNGTFIGYIQRECSAVFFAFGPGVAQENIKVEVSQVVQTKTKGVKILCSVSAEFK